MFLLYFTPLITIMKQHTKPSDFSALIGIDWADKKHDIHELPMDSSQASFSVISANSESIFDWANELRIKYPNGHVAIACELKKGPLVYALEQFDHIVLFPINPQTVAKYRQAFSFSGAKDDPTDARIMVDLLQTQMHKFSPHFPDKPAVRALALLTQNRRSLVQDRVDLTNKITSILKNYFPQVISWFQEKDTIIFCDFLTRWPTLQKARKAHRSTLIKFFNEHNSRYSSVNEQRIDAIKQAIPLTSDSAVIEPGALMIQILIPQLRNLIIGIESLDNEIKARYRKQKDRHIFDSFPGAGPQLAPRLFAAFGTDRSRYHKAADIQKLAGIAPVIERSGQQSWTHWRYSCPKFLRQTFVEWAGQSIRYSFWAKGFYEQQRAKGKRHNAAVRALAFKWIRIAFRCWKDNTPYDESTYLNALKLRGSTLLQSAIST